LLPGEYWLGVIGLAPLVGGILAFWSYGHGEITFVVRTVAVTAVLLSVSLFSVAGPRISVHQNSASLVSLAKNYAGDPSFGTFDEGTPSLVYYAAERVERLADPQQVTQHLVSSPGALVVTRGKKLDSLKELLPPDVVVLERQRKFLRRDDILLLGRRALHVDGRASAASATQR
jgi:hypothetical protein